MLVFNGRKYPLLLASARNTFRKMKTLRHPSLLRFLDGIEVILFYWFCGKSWHDGIRGLSMRMMRRCFLISRFLFYLPFFAYSIA